MSAAIIQMLGNGARCACAGSGFAMNVGAVVSGACAILSSTGKMPARRENNAHKRLSEEASGADVFHMALNGAAASVCVCVCSLYAYK